MHRFEYRFTGLWHGGKVVALAPDGETALIMVIERVRAEGFDPATIRLESSGPIETPEVVYFDDGNY